MNITEHTGKTTREGSDMSALIAAQPGPLRDALQTLLGMMPQIEIVYRVSNVSSMRRTVVEHHPALVLLDTNLSEEKVSQVVKMIKANGGGSQCLVLADNVQQQQLAQSAGADAALLKGFPAARLLEAIRTLIIERETESNAEP